MIFVGRDWLVVSEVEPNSIACPEPAEGASLPADFGELSRTGLIQRTAV
jgi:hypothetical protein